MDSIECVVTKMKDGSLKLTVAESLPELDRGDELRVSLDCSSGEAPWKESMLIAEAAMLAQENRKRERSGLPPLNGATAEAFDKSLSKQVAELTAMVAALIGKNSEDEEAPKKIAKKK